jgi:hypothetical protein
MADPIVLRWEQEGLAALLLLLERLNNKLEDVSEETDDADKKTKKFAKTTRGLGTEARKTGKAMRAFGDAFSGINSGAGRATRTAGRLFQVFGNISALGAGGVAFAGVTAGVFALGGAAAMGAKELATLAANGREAAEELRPFSDAGFFAALDESQLQRFDRVGASFDAIGTATKGAGLALANEFAPEIERGATLIVAFGLAVSDSVVEIGRFIRGIGGAASTVGDFIQGLGPLARAGLLAVTGGLSEAVVAAGEFADGLDDTGGAAGDYIDRARALISVQQGVNKSFKEGADVLGMWDARAQIASAEFKAFSDTLPEIVVRTREIDEAAQAQIKSIQAIADQYGKNKQVQQEAALAILAIEERQARDVDAVREELSQKNRERLQQDFDLGRQNLEQLGSLSDQYRDAQISIATDSLNAISSLATTASDVLAREGARGAIAMFRISQAAALANIGVLTAEAIMNAMAKSPFPIAAAATAGAVGAAQAAQVAAQQPPQIQAHMGAGLSGAGQMVGSPSMAPDERTSPGGRRTLDQEATISSTGVNAIVNALNAARSPGGGLRTVRAVIGRGHLDRENERSLRGGTSRFARQNKRGSLAAVRAKNREP